MNRLRGYRARWKLCARATGPACASATVAGLRADDDLVVRRRAGHVHPGSKASFWPIDDACKHGWSPASTIRPVRSRCRSSSKRKIPGGLGDSVPHFTHKFCYRAQK